MDGWKDGVYGTWDMKKKTKQKGWGRVRRVTKTTLVCWTPKKCQCPPQKRPFQQNPSFPYTWCGGRQCVRGAVNESIRLSALHYTFLSATYYVTEIRVTCSAFCLFHPHHLISTSRVQSYYRIYGDEQIGSVAHSRLPPKVASMWMNTFSGIIKNDVIKVSRQIKQNKPPAPYIYIYTWSSGRHVTHNFSSYFPFCRSFFLISLKGHGQFFWHICGTPFPAFHFMTTMRVWNPTVHMNKWMNEYTPRNEMRDNRLFKLKNRGSINKRKIRRKSIRGKKKGRSMFCCDILNFFCGSSNPSSKGGSGDDVKYER